MNTTAKNIYVIRTKLQRNSNTKYPAVSWSGTVVEAVEGATRGRLPVTSFDLAVFHVFTEATVSSQDAQPAEQSTAKAAIRSLIEAASRVLACGPISLVTESFSRTEYIRSSYGASKRKLKER